MLKRSIQLTFSTNCMAEVPISKPVYRGHVTSRPQTAPIKAIQRTTLACSSRPRASSTTPKTIGVQIARLNNPIFVFLLLVEPDEIRHEDKHTQDHHQRIVIDVAGLDPAHQASDPTDQLPGAIDHRTVDDGLVAGLPEAQTQTTCTAGNDVFVDPVEVVLVLEQVVDRLAGRLDRCGQC